MSFPNLTWEKRYFQKGYSLVAGADEVGRGAWAGPVVAAAVILALPNQIDTFYQNALSQEIIINDSKLLKARQRRQTAVWLKTHVLAWGVGETPPSYINRLGLSKATHMAFRQAVRQIHHQNLIDLLFLDAFYVPYIRHIEKPRQHPIKKGDRLVLSIAAASIIAKDYRDRLMLRLSRRHPHYKWGRNKGYGTRAHQQALLKHGSTRHHRTQFISTWKAHFTQF